ncbi:MAG: amidohydrolase family protein [Caldilineaceae bacterium]|nr:amidohydrolase family protein [Caldilineaceae bacterium]
MLVDAHSHIFPRIHGLNAAGPTRGLGYGRAMVGPEERQVTPPFGKGLSYTPETLLANLDWAGVDRAVLLQGPFYGECDDYVFDALRRYGDKLVGAAYFDPWMEDSRSAFDELFEKGGMEAGFRALKLECSVPTGLCGIHPQARLDAPDLAWLWRELERREQVLVLDLGGVGSRSYQTAAVRAIAERHPRLKVVVAHLGQPSPAAEADADLWRQWQEQIDLGRLPNVWFDCASLVAYVHEEGYPFPTVERYLRLAIERIGAPKIMWGSDQPGTLVHATYRQYAALAKLHTGFLGTRNQALVLGENALEVYG